MTLFNFVMLAISKILGDLVSMQISFKCKNLSIISAFSICMTAPLIRKTVALHKSGSVHEIAVLKILF